MPSPSVLRLHEEGVISVCVDTDLARVRQKALSRRYAPTGTVRCVGVPLFRSGVARDLGLLLDLDEHVEAWQCLPDSMNFVDRDGVIVSRVPDFLVRYACGSESFLDAGAIDLKPAAEQIAYSAICENDFRAEPAISNAREMLRYARTIVPLGDRIRLAAYLDDVGSTTLVEAASGMRESVEPIGAVIALVLQRVIRIDWQDNRLSPQSRVEAVR